MRAAVTTRFGLPEVVQVREVQTPTPANNEVLVRVRASSVCFGDRKSLVSDGFAHVAIRKASHSASIRLLPGKALRARIQARSRLGYREGGVTTNNVR
jgi:hypothetical protein